MADRIKDAEDRFLESVFELEPVSDDGFSSRVVKRVRREIWMRRLALPLAVAIGGLLAFKPVAGLLATAYEVMLGLPNDLFASATSSLPPIPLIVTGAMILVAALMSISMLEE